MIRRLIATTAVVLTMTAPAIVHAQGVPGGIERGAHEGGKAAGPVGAIVGGTIGGVVGGVAGILGVDERPRFRTYVVEQKRPSYRYEQEVRVGTVLPESGLSYYEVPEQYGHAHEYRYTVVNGRTVLVEPRTRRIVEIVE
ncbi:MULTISPECIES: DUF1236 domain-containing protein [Rhodopseudomonas]|uniref:DUF1236 domain-containing protein n=1 Tax=Rhodopseudomonas palustris TaxID=1076 RepID=A0A0D7F1I2_RHOPL|nr:MULTISPECIES: DUF1236 domain-containing protein [Rhodopseudomonas]KIZ45572.1 hypothetical protein OO17_07645 [Rhodopseudomonas palustris]MDF3814024.1 DUF1236 domain-containing protein [Rhodopseudomonas sp. BAL398]WOK16843.1 DUF1236 domain-containing protein [Rhodopseudomonas sp. BAL398]